MIYGMIPEQHKSRSHRHYCRSVTVALKVRLSRTVSSLMNCLSSLDHEHIIFTIKKTRQQPEKVIQYSYDS